MEPPATSELKSSFLREYVERGYMHQCTDLEGLDLEMSSKTVTAYLGFDATADSLHVGSLLQIMILRLLQRHGHRPIVLVGGGTTKVGDPSGKDESRNMLDEAQIGRNIEGIAGIFGTFLEFGEEEKALLVNNADWLDELRYVEFLREYGRHFSVNRMLTMDSVKTRLSREQPLSFLEFNYMILQAYDFVELHRRHQVTLQFGGSDQWGNIVSGVELGRRVTGAKLIGMTAPLVTTSDGRKMGKTADGAVWLTPEKLPPYEYWQFWRNVDDADVIRFLKFFTDLAVDEVDSLPFRDANDINRAKRLLADEATALLHGPDVLPDIHATVDALFSSGGGSGASNALPKLLLGGADFDDQGRVSVVDVLVKLDFAKSKSEAKRLIKGGGARLDDAKVADLSATVSRDQLLHADVKVSSGKKKHAILQLAEEGDIQES